MSRLLVIGTGLLGGSFALAMRQAGCFAQIDGYDADASVMTLARQRGLIDGAVTDLDAAVALADAVLIAVPTDTIATLVRRIGKRSRAAAPTVFDVGSVKGSVLAALRKRGGVPSWFVPSHPMAGSEHRGPEAADAGLFRDRPVILTPQPETDADALERVRGWWRATGAHVVETSAPVHDEMVALTSHLPHLVAYAFMHWVDRPHSGNPVDFAGPGLQDFTRIAASDAAMWRRILAENQVAVLAQYDGWLASVTQFGELLREGRFDELEALLANAQAARLRMMNRIDE